jgi:hypothetical protein
VAGSPIGVDDLQLAGAAEGYLIAQEHELDGQGGDHRECRQVVQEGKSCGHQCLSR